MVELKKTAIHAIPELVNGARLAFKSGKSKETVWRKNQLIALRKMLNDNHDDICKALKDDLGANDFFSKILEVGLIHDEIDTALSNLHNWVKPKKVPTPALLLPGSSYTVKEPYGTVLIISAWNYPFGVLLIPLISAIAAGNTVVLKPSEISVNSTHLLSELLEKYMDMECIKIINGDANECQELLKEKFDLCFYTGSSAVGRIVMEACAKHLCPVVLELGGQSPVVVAKDANLQMTAKRIAWGKFTMNMGQTCVSPNHIFVEKDIYEEFIEMLKKVLIEFYGEHPKQSPDVHRIINSRHCQRLENLILNDDTIEILVGGIVENEERYFSPTVVKATRQSKCMKEEIFGPILPILPVESVKEAIEFINTGEKPLAAYLFTKNNDTEEFFVSNVSSGGITINDIAMHVANPNLPFGGVGNSGIGAYHGKHGFNTFSHKKPILYKKQWTNDPSIRYPPYNESKIQHYLTAKKVSSYLPCSIQ